jgi:hypothetical protein
MSQKKVVIVGGVSGLLLAQKLESKYDVTVLER